MLYFFQRHTNHTLRIAKFDDKHAEPLDVYFTNPTQPSCSCPAYKDVCKHVTMARQWILIDPIDRNEIALCYDDDQQAFVEHPFEPDMTIYDALANPKE